MKQHIALLALSALSIAAQAGAADDLKNWFVTYAEKNHIAETVVVSPGYKMMIDGKPVPVFGNQRCPLADGMHVWFFGGDPQGGSGCIVVEKNTDAVMAQFVVDGKKVAERWTVEHKAPDKALLRRPNGDYLAHAK